MSNNDNNDQFIPKPLVCSSLSATDSEIQSAPSNYECWKCGLEPGDEPWSFNSYTPQNCIANWGVSSLAELSCVDCWRCEDQVLFGGGASHPDRPLLYNEPQHSAYCIDTPARRLTRYHWQLSCCDQSQDCGSCRTDESRCRNSHCVLDCLGAYCDPMATNDSCCQEGSWGSYLQINAQRKQLGSPTLAAFVKHARCDGPVGNRYGSPISPSDSAYDDSLQKLSCTCPSPLSPVQISQPAPGFMDQNTIFFRVDFEKSIEIQGTPSVPYLNIVFIEAIYSASSQGLNQDVSILTANNERQAFYDSKRNNGKSLIFKYTLTSGDPNPPFSVTVNSPIVLNGASMFGAKDGSPINLNFTPTTLTSVVINGPSPTPTRTTTKTPTPTRTTTRTPTQTRTQTRTPTPTRTTTKTPTPTSTTTATPTQTRTPTKTLTPTRTLTRTRTPTPTLTSSATATPTPTPTAAIKYDCWVCWSDGPHNLGPKTIAACAGRRVPGVQNLADLDCCLQSNGTYSATSKSCDLNCRSLIAICSDPKCSDMCPGAYCLPAPLNGSCCVNGYYFEYVNTWFNVGPDGSKNMKPGAPEFYAGFTCAMQMASLGNEYSAAGLNELSCPCPTPTQSKTPTRTRTPTRTPTATRTSTRGLTPTPTPTPTSTSTATATPTPSSSYTTGSGQWYHYIP